MSKILVYPNKILRKKTEAVVKVDEKLLKQISILNQKLISKIEKL